jgi:ankyrin repeat protein
MIVPEWDADGADAIVKKPSADDYGALFKDARQRMFHACETGDSDRVYLLIKKAEEGDQSMFDENSVSKLVDATSEDGVTPLFVACKAGSVECARLLLKAGASTTRRTTTHNLTALWIAAQKGKTACVELMLVQRRAPIDGVSKDGRTPLYAACESGSAECVKALLDAKADIERRRFDKSTPLIVAAIFGRTEVVEMLLAAGAKLKPKDADGTALDNCKRHCTISGNREQCVEMLTTALAERGRYEMHAANDDLDDGPELS